MEDVSLTVAILHLWADELAGSLATDSSTGSEEEPLDRSSHYPLSSLAYSRELFGSKGKA